MGKKRRVPEDWDALGAIDSHAHLEVGTYGSDLEAVLARAWLHGLSHIVLIAASQDPLVFEQTETLAASDNRLSMVAGIHPHCASHHATLAPVVARLVTRKALVGVGEIGLDYHYDFAPRGVQQEVFVQQLGLARDAGLPVVLHIREAFVDSLALLDAEGACHRGVIHCFTGSPREAMAYVERGFHISIPGIVTFGAGADDLRAAVAAIPLNRLLVETDSPYLTPHPFRGRTNEPSYLAFTLEVVASVKGIPLSEAAQVTRENTRSLFRLPNS
jgi:TatD DNase family protein